MRTHVYTLPGVIDRVIDGDTVVVHVGILPGKELHGESVRVAGINAPELRNAGGAAARDYLSELLPAGTEVLVIASREDKYGRLLARIVLPDGRDASDLMLSAGHAVPM